MGVIIASRVGSTVHYDSDQRERRMYHSAEEEEEEEEELDGSEIAAIRT